MKYIQIGNQLLFLALITILSACQSNSEEPNSKKPPNILLIYIDDLGYSDLGCYGKEYGNDFFQTPNIDRLASRGIKFTQAYASAPLCSPSRAALLTGKSPARLGFEFVTKFQKDEDEMTNLKWKERFKDFSLVPPRYTLNLPLEEVTLAEKMNQYGYETGIIGKWHVASHHLRYKGWSLTHGPQQQGFSTAIETFGSHPYGFDAGEKKDTIQSGYPIDELTTSAIQFIKKDRSKPFFLYLSHYYVHTPLDGRMQQLFDKYRRIMGAEVKEEKIKYAAFVEMMDHYVGQVLSAIELAGIEEETIILFTSDNGGHPHFAYNRPYRGSKWNLYEGGIRVPFIVSWPGKVQSGLENNTPIIQTDIMSTLTAVATNQQQRESVNDGESILPFILNPEKINENVWKRSIPMVWHFPYYHPEGRKYKQAIPTVGIEDGVTSQTRPQSAIRIGDDKLLYFYESEKAELYDLNLDPSEQNNLIEEKPEKARELKSALFDYLNDVGARMALPHSEFLTQ